MPPENLHTRLAKAQAEQEPWSGESHFRVRCQLRHSGPFPEHGMLQHVAARAQGGRANLGLPGTAGIAGTAAAPVLERPPRTCRALGFHLGQ